MKNSVQIGNAIQVTAPVGGVVGGDVFKLGDLVGIPVSSVAEGEQFTLNITGIYRDLPKTVGTAFAYGEALTWNAGTKKWAAAADGDFINGYAAADAAAPDTLCLVLLSH